MSDRPFEKAMMYMHAQEKLKECEHDWVHFTNGAKVCTKCCEHDWAYFSDGVKVCRKCLIEKRHIR